MAGKKTFVAGEVLTAQDVNDFLMDQSVMNFATSAARASAIPTPTEGMTTYVQDRNQLETFDGAEYRGMSGLQLVKTQTILSGVASVTVTDAFSATYNNYKIMVANGVGSTTAFLRLQLGSAAADYYCSLNSVVYASNSALLQTTMNGAIWGEAGWTSADYIGLNVDLINPNLSKRTLMSAAFSGTSVGGHTAGYHNANTSFTAFTLTPSTGTLTGGTIYVYGYGT
jgi:hypothetical protein